MRLGVALLPGPGSRLLDPPDSPSRPGPRPPEPIPGPPRRRPVLRLRGPRLPTPGFRAGGCTRLGWASAPPRALPGQRPRAQLGYSRNRAGGRRDQPKRPERPERAERLGNVRAQPRAGFLLRVASFGAVHGNFPLFRWLSRVHNASSQRGPRGQNMPFCPEKGSWCILLYVMGIHGQFATRSCSSVFQPHRSVRRKAAGKLGRRRTPSLTFSPL